MLPQHAPGAKLPRVYQQFHAKKSCFCATNVLLQGYAPFESNWLNMREQGPGANLLRERVVGASSPVCTNIYGKKNQERVVGVCSGVSSCVPAFRKLVGLFLVCMGNPQTFLSLAAIESASLHI